jgi:hypothetical protein
MAPAEQQQLVVRLAEGVRKLRAADDLLRETLDSVGLKTAADIDALAEDDPRLPRFKGVMLAWEDAQIDVCDAAIVLCEAAGLVDKRR